MEIEAPTTSQKADASRAQIIEFAEGGASEVDIISKLVASGAGLDRAKEILPAILEASKSRRRRRRVIRFASGGITALGGFGFGILALVDGVFWVWPFLVGALGVALMTGYIRNPIEHL